MRKIVTFLIQAYRYAISPYFARSCRFTPSCSAYALEAVNQYGVFRGLRLAAKRLLRCHPFSAGGYDPVPACGHAHNIQDSNAYHHTPAADNNN